MQKCQIPVFQLPDFLQPGRQVGNMKVLAFFLVFLLNWILRCFEQIQSKINCHPSGLAKTTS